MAFNFMQFAGGFADVIVDKVKAEEAQARDDESWDRRFNKQQDAINKRTRGQKRRATEEAAAEAAQALKAAGFNDDISKYALGQGNTYATTIAGYGSTAMENGSDPNTLFKYSETMDEFKAAVGPQGRFKGDLPEGFDKSPYLEFDPTALGAILKPVAKPVKSLGELRAGVVQEMLSLDPNSEEYGALSKRNESIIKEQLVTAKKEDSDPYSNADLRNDFKLFSGITQVAQGFESLEGQITTAIGGREVAAQVSVLNAANMMLKRNDSSSVKSSNLEAFVQPAFDNAVREIRENAKRVSAINSASDQEKLNLGDSVVEFGSYYYPTPEGQTTYTSAQAANLYKKGLLKVGNVLSIDGRIQTYVETPLEYKGLNRDNPTASLAWPFVYARPEQENGDSKFYPIGFYNE
tara:strand:+ start:836 stop:2056 length:1221 start_codon:yes stop_codon:yes gene_type:complete